ENGNDIQAVAISGRPYPGDQLPSTRVVEGLDYASPEDAIDPQVLAKRLKESAKDALGQSPDLWHIHNHSLGKNSAMPGVVANLAEDGENLLLQMHDFAEDGRPDNYRLNLERPECAAYLYPDISSVHYGVINGRDYEILRQTGLDLKRLHLLANPVEAHHNEKDSDSSHILETLGAERLILYPVRAVRRKNFGELLLWSALAEPGDVFATTLGPTNKNYHVAYQRWQSFAQKNKLPVHFGIGETHDWPFETIMQAAHAIISTSIAEGFGLAFLEPWLYGKSIAGRDLPAITADFKAEGIRLDCLYESLPIPTDWIDLDLLKADIALGLNEAYNAYQRPLPDDAVERAVAAISPKPNHIDFAGLNEAQQETVLQRVLTDPSVKSRLPKFGELSQPGCIRENADCIAKTYSLRRYAEKMSQLYQCICSSHNTGATQYIDPSKVLEGFLQPERFRLLRT
ncbi:MAG: hypothetical protein ACPGSB_10210, partial [Opitutales bacterium]